MRKLAVVVAFVASLVVAAPAAAVPRSSGGCAAFGGNVAGLATALGADFGAAASSVATLRPQAFPDLVVHPEQSALCP